jgi:hypothetical protein
VSPRIGITENNARKLLFWMIGITVFLALILVGRAVTPVDKGGQLQFLSPRVAQVASYQRRVEKWALEMGGIETDMQVLLETNASDLFAQDRAFQDINSRAVSLASAVDSTRTPDSLGGLHDLLLAAATAHQAAVSALGQWISEPSGDTENAAQDALDSAASMLARIYENPWVVIDPATEDPSAPATR